MSIRFCVIAVGVALVSFLTASAEPARVLEEIPGSDAYLEGYNLQRQGRYPDAIRAYRECIEADGPLSPYAWARTAFCHSMAGNKDAAYDTFYYLFDAYPDGPWVSMGQAYLATVYMTDERHREAAQHFAEVIDIPFRPWWFGTYIERAADMFLRDPDYERLGYAYYREQTRNARFRAARGEAAKILTGSPYVDDQILAVKGLVEAREFDDAERAMARLRPVLRLTPPRRATAAYLEALVQYVAGERDRGRAGMADAVQNHEDDEYAPAILLLFIRAALREGEHELAAPLASLLADRFPAADEAGDALWWVARHHESNDRAEQAVAGYRALADQLPKHERADAALFAVGELQRERGLNTSAVDAYDQLRQRYPASGLVPEAMYRKGAIHQNNGNDDEAKSAYRSALRGGMGDFYAHRAADKLHGLGETNAAGRNMRVNAGESFVRPIALNAPAYEPLTEEVNDDPRFQRLLFFGEHGLEEAEWEALALFEILGDSEQLDQRIYQVMGEAGVAYTAMQFAHQHDYGVNDGFPDVRRMRVRYPRAYWPLVLEVAKETNLDPYLILAVARQESTYRPDLTSHAGARGLMQVMPSTAEWLAGAESALSHSEAGRLDVPRNSLRLGAYYIRRMLNRSGGNLVYAIASYNAGPGNVDRWRDRWPNASMESFVNNIPFGETNNFVRRVLANYAAYHSLYTPLDLEGAE